jgi:hypothetical protein
LKGLAGRRRRCTGGGMYPSSSYKEGSADLDAVKLSSGESAARRDMAVSRPEAPGSRPRSRTRGDHREWGGHVHPAPILAPANPPSR